MTSLEEHLSELGLSDKESCLYLAALELGKSTMSDLARKSKVNRATAYGIIENLKEKGLLSLSVYKKKKLYIASSPEKLSDLLDEKRKIFERILPQLQGIDNFGMKKPKIQYFEGERAIISVFLQNHLSAKGEILTIAGSKFFHEGVLKQIPDYIERRVKNKTLLKMIVPDFPEMKAWVPKDVEQLRQTKLVPHETYPFKIQIDIYHDKVVMYSYEDVIALSIENKNIADTLRSFFYLTWNCIR